jgi:NAD/NADP transhydrogenase alpha subunit
VKRLSAKAIVTVETGAGLEAGFPDDAYANAGAHLADLQQVLDGSAVIAKVRAPDASQTPRAGGVLISLGGRDAGLEKRLQERPVSHLALERVPRISRAQTMDVLSSQASVAGYVAVLEGAGLLDILLPMLTTAAGIIKPAKMIALGAGVAGLQAIATARRLGAVTGSTSETPRGSRLRASVRSLSRWISPCQRWKAPAATPESNLWNSRSGSAGRLRRIWLLWTSSSPQPRSLAGGRRY